MLYGQVVQRQLMVVTGSYNSNPPIGGWATPRAHSPHSENSENSFCCKKIALASPHLLGQFKNVITCYRSSWNIHHFVQLSKAGVTNAMKII